LTSPPPRRRSPTPPPGATPYETAKSTARHTKAKRAVELAYAELEAFEAAAPA
jgi:hypothetical protein